MSLGFHLDSFHGQLKEELRLHATSGSRFLELKIERKREKMQYFGGLVWYSTAQGAVWLLLIDETERDICMFGVTSLDLSLIQRSFNSI